MFSFFIFTNIHRRIKIVFLIFRRAGKNGFSRPLLLSYACSDFVVGSPNIENEDNVLVVGILLINKKNSR